MSFIRESQLNFSFIPEKSLGSMGVCPCPDRMIVARVRLEFDFLYIRSIGCGHCFFEVDRGIWLNWD